jgi:hypothetical protein
MNKLHIASLALALALPLAAGCSPKPAGSDDTVARAVAKTTKATSMIGRQVEREIAKARVELRTKDISLDHGVGIDVNGKHYGGSGDGHDHAAITPKGDLVIDGKAVPVTPAQRALLLEYREQMIGVAEAGMAVGAKGADLAGAAVSEALGSIFGDGDTKAMEQRIEEKAESLKQDAKVICTHLPAMLDTQRRLAAALPAFKPYADMTQDDVDDCARDIDRHGAWAKE